MMVHERTHVGAVGMGATMPTIPLYASLDTPATQVQRTFAEDSVIPFDGLGQTHVRRGSGTAQGGHFGPHGYAYGNQELFGLGQTHVRRGSGTMQSGHFGVRGNGGGEVEMFGLGQTHVRRGSGTAQGGHFGPHGYAYGNQELFGLGQRGGRGSGQQQGGHSGPASLTAGEEDGSEMFGLGDDSASMF